MMAGAALLLAAVVLVEDGPLGARWSRIHDGKAMAAAAVTAAAKVDAARDQTLATARRALQQHRHDRLLSSALGDGGVEGARAFLKAYAKDEARPRVQAKLRELCAAKVMEGPSDPPLTRMLHAVQRGGCATARGVVYFRVTGPPPSPSDAQAFMDDVVRRAAAPTRDAPYEALRIPEGDDGGDPYVLLRMRRWAGMWQITVTPTVADQPVAGAEYVHSGSLALGRGP
jgi:hypothetical protein